MNTELEPESVIGENINLTKIVLQEKAAKELQRLNRIDNLSSLKRAALSLEPDLANLKILLDREHPSDYSEFSEAIRTKMGSLLFKLL